MLVYLQNLILEMLAREEGLRETSERLCREVERLAPGVICSILAFDADGVIHTLAAPSLPQSYNDAIDGLRMGPKAGSCGTAAFRRCQITVTDIENDPLWVDYREVALSIGLRACWSSPIISAGRVVATFAFYYREKRGPTDFEREIVAKSLQLCQLAFERDDRLRVNRQLLYTDSLTGLHNRACFEHALVDPRAAGASALMLVDIDDLKMVNDTFGHRTGDSLIRVIAQRITETAAPLRVFRIGGDELAILTDAADVVPLAERILGALSQAADCNGHNLLPGITIGAATRAADDESGETMRQNADLALYHGKEDGGRGSLVLYTPELRTAMNRRLGAIDQLRRALAEDRVEARYQPITQLDSGEVTSFEALVRIREPDGRIVAATDFQEGFADVRNAAGVTRAMLTAVSADLRSWLDSGFAVGRVAINLAPADFAHGRLVEEVQSIFAGARVPLERLTLEITETVYLGRRELQVQRQMEALRGLGVKLALDDFGTGYASLTHLLFTPVDMLKIDKSFVDHLDNDGRAGGAVVNGLMRIAEKLEIEVIAEGVESVEQRERLVALGCKLGQGHLFAGALDKTEMEGLLQTAPMRLPATLLPSSLLARSMRRQGAFRAA
ncbi:MAG TPA: EAL domain-containing protein [Sphingomonas sp.]|nr:EAL domain-containing protein [Sphingomonas sp.]